MGLQEIKDVLEHNKRFVDNKEYEQFGEGSKPIKKMVILSCMDTRLIELLPKAMNIKRGDAKLIKNAGGIVQYPFGTVMKSIILTIYEFDIKDIVVVGHTDCGATKTETKGIVEKMLERGIEENTLSILENSDINVEDWLKAFDSVEDKVMENIKIIRNHPLVPKDVSVHGLIIDSRTGALEVLVDGYEYK